MKILNPVSEAFDKERFTWENDLFRKARLIKPVNKQVKECSKCEDMNIVGYSENAVGYGNLNAEVMFVAQSLCTQCMSTQIPYTEGSCYILDAALRLSGLLRKDIYLTNVVKCHPPKNRASMPSEISNCVCYLAAELEIINPKLVVALGRDAANTIEKFKLLPSNSKLYATRHTASFMYSGPSGIKKWVIDLSMEIDKYVNKSR